MNSTTASNFGPGWLDGRSVHNRAKTAAGLSAIVATSYFYAPWCFHGPVICPLRAMTGIECPGCGLTRSFCSMAHGHLAAAFGFHWLGPLFFVAAVAAVPLLLIEIARQRRIEAFHRVLFSTRLAYAVATVLLIQWTVRVVVETHSGELLASMRGSIFGGVAQHVMNWVV